MQIITPMEILDLVIMTLGIGYIFKDAFEYNPNIKKNMDVLDYYRNTPTTAKWDNLKFAIIVAAPAVILHEMGHKFVALSAGVDAIFHASYFWLGIGILLKLIGSGFIFFVPGYVSYSGASLSPLWHSLISFSGPLMNLLIFLIALIVLKNVKLSSRAKKIWYITKQINIFLFVFNMIPIPPFDGFGVFSNLIKSF